MVRPAGQLRGRPLCVFVLVTAIAGIRNLLSLRLSRCDEMEVVGGDERPTRKFRQYLGHVASDALTAGAARRMMGMLLQRRGMRPVLAAYAVAGKANLVFRLCRTLFIFRGGGGRTH